MAQQLERPPYTTYGTIMATFAGGLALAGAVARSLRRDPQCHSALDFLVLGAASFKAARTLSHDEVTSFIREPFVRGHAHTGEDEDPVEGGMEQAIGSHRLELGATPPRRRACTRSERERSRLERAAGRGWPALGLRRGARA